MRNNFYRSPGNYSNPRYNGDYGGGGGGNQDYNYAPPSYGYSTTRTVPSMEFRRRSAMNNDNNNRYAAGGGGEPSNFIKRNPYRKDNVNRDDVVVTPSNKPAAEKITAPYEVPPRFQHHKDNNVQQQGKKKLLSNFFKNFFFYKFLHSNYF